MLLWFGPLLVLAAGILGLVLARRRRPAPITPLTSAEEARLRAIVERGQG
jgi:cytochrome c-type biogenesis protein CcmH/NrfF